MSIFRRPSFNFVVESFAAFRYRNYRLWFIGQLISLIGTWMQATAQGYLFYKLTGSAAFLGYLGFISGAPAWFLMIYGGLVADRAPRRSLLMMTQSAKMFLAFILGGLVWSKLVQPWHILALALLLGVANAFDTPPRKSLAADLVKRADLTNAMTLNDTMYNISVIIGPAVGAAVYSLVGPSWCFLLNGFSFMAVIGALFMMRVQYTPVLSPGGPALAAIADGFRYVRSNRLVQTLTASELLVSILGDAPIILLPAWAVKILNGDVNTNGLLLSVHGVGAVLGGLLIAILASRRNRGKVWTLGSLLMPLAMFAFTLSRSLPFSLVCIGLIGLSQVNLSTNNAAIIQSGVPDELRGRVMGLYALMYTGGQPLGALAVGLLTNRTNESVTFYACSAGMLLFAILIWLFRPEVRRIE